MLDGFKFETFVDVHSNIFNEYLSTVISTIPKNNEEYCEIQRKIDILYKQYPNVLGLFDQEQVSELTNEECRTVLEVLRLKNKLVCMEMQSIYLRGCYDGIGYLKKSGIL